MCDFREPEQYFCENKIPIEQRKYNDIIHLAQLNRDGTSDIISLKKGYYLIATTGSFYSYCDGYKIIFLY